MSDQDYENTIGRLDDQIAELEVENAKLRDIIAECADDFSSAAEGNGINFYQCAIDLRKALEVT